MILLIDVLTITFVVIGTGITLFTTIRASIWNQTIVIKELLTLVKTEASKNKSAIRELNKRITNIEGYLSKRQNILTHSFITKYSIDDEEI